jgi:hypothetical protein
MEQVVVVYGNYARDDGQKGTGEDNPFCNEFAAP